MTIDPWMFDADLIHEIFSERVREQLVEWCCLFRARSAGYLWLIITVGPVALTIDLIKAHLST